MAWQCFLGGGTDSKLSALVSPAVWVEHLSGLAVGFLEALSCDLSGNQMYSLLCL